MAFTEEMNLCHSEQTENNECLASLCSFQNQFKICCKQERMANGQKLAGMAGVHPRGPGPEIEERIQAMGTKSPSLTPRQIFPLLALRPEIILKYELHKLQVRMNKLMQQETLQEERTNKLKEELAEAQAALQNQPIPPSANSDLIKRLKEEVKEAEETNTKQTSYVQKLSDQKQHMETEAQEYSNHIVKYVKDIAELQKAKEDLEKSQQASLQLNLRPK